MSPVVQPFVTSVLFHMSPVVQPFVTSVLFHMSPVVQPFVTSVFMLCFQHVQEQESNTENNNKKFKSRRITWML